MNEDEERVRQEAHKLWEQEGRPEGRSERHWAEAREIVALRDSMQVTLTPVAETLDDPVEPAFAAQNQGDIPGITDRGDEVPAPDLAAAREVADEHPLVTDRQEGAGKKGAAKSKPADPKASAGKPASKSAKDSGKPKAKPAKGAEKDTSKRRGKAAEA
ncbi:hypothetical protein GCM10011390_09320 [Aureimonas endophytica]|uniref:DUF2934 family protein n=1 Tax=Aureimonas endophytica TaxID=2027858 RepID=A0A916ZEG3_9HYPH|nr:DUF2934 domain-containing protein [Aureimonas endophytica]GGD92735.1 hypothetical protein GCM10011390_09320 [Aureimonas endophytica]